MRHIPTKPVFLRNPSLNWGRGKWQKSKLSRGEICVQISRPPANGVSLDSKYGPFVKADCNSPKWADSEIIGHRVTEWQSDRYPRVLNTRVGEIFVCLISINSLTLFAHRGINSPTRFARRGVIKRKLCKYCIFLLNIAYSFLPVIFVWTRQV